MYVIKCVILIIIVVLSQVYDVVHTAIPWHKVCILWRGIELIYVLQRSSQYNSERKLQDGWLKNADKTKIFLHMIIYSKFVLLKFVQECHELDIFSFN